MTVSWKVWVPPLALWCLAWVGFFAWKFYVDPAATQKSMLVYQTIFISPAIVLTILAFVDAVAGKSPAKKVVKTRVKKASIKED